MIEAITFPLGEGSVSLTPRSLDFDLVQQLMGAYRLKVRREAKAMIEEATALAQSPDESDKAVSGMLVAEANAKLTQQPSFKDLGRAVLYDPGMIAAVVKLLGGRTDADVERDVRAYPNALEIGLLAWRACGFEELGKSQGRLLAMLGGSPTPPSEPS
jgi:hypothetical protein